MALVSQGKKKLKKKQLLMPYRQHNLVSNVPNMALTTDINTRNPIGMVFLNGKLYVAENSSHVVSEYSPEDGSLLRTISTPASPTGLVVNRTRNFVITSGSTSGPAILIVVTRSGTIAGWNPQVSATSFVSVVTSSKVFTGATIIPYSSFNVSPLLFVTNFSGAVVEVYDSSFTFLSSSSFTDSGLVSDGYSPLNVVRFLANVTCQSEDAEYINYSDLDQKQSKEGTETGAVPMLFVTFARLSSTGALPIQGKGNGFIDVFSIKGSLVSRYASRGQLDTPYGIISGKNGILVANNGSGDVIKFTTREFFCPENASTVIVGEYQTPIRTPSDGTIQNDNIWSLVLANANKEEARIYFTAGINAIFTTSPPTFDGLVGELVTADCEGRDGKRVKENQEQQTLVEVCCIKNGKPISCTKTCKNFQNQHPQFKILSYFQSCTSGCSFSKTWLGCCS